MTIEGKSNIADLKWINIFEVGDTGKTKIFAVENRETGFRIGIIKWYGAFRQYSFFPADNCVFEKTCLYDIAAFMTQKMDERKQRLKMDLDDMPYSSPGAKEFNEKLCGN